MAECTIAAGTWSGDPIIDPSSTDPMCATGVRTFTDERFTTLNDFLAGDCPPGCECASTSATPPDCIAEQSLACSSSGTSWTAQRLDDMTLQYTVTLVTERGECTVSYVLTWTGP